MKINKSVTKALFIKRLNRFEASVKLNGEEIIVHVPNTGRCKEILIPESIVILRKEDNKSRKTKYDLIAVYKEDKLINIDSQIPNKVVYEALLNKKIDKLKDYTLVQREKTFGNSRFDFKLNDENEKEYYLEVKGVTLENNGNTMFPDAPTKRGKKHLMELIEVKKTGRGAGVLFLIQLSDAKKFSPNDEMDEAFGKALRKAYKNGVDVFAYECAVGEDYIELREKVKIDFGC